MYDKRKILSIEKSLGFKWSGRGLSRQGGSGQIPRVKEFEDAVKQLKQQFVQFNAHGLHSSPDFQRQCEKIIATHGPQLWPPSLVDRSDWLVDAEDEDWEGLYQRNLYFNDSDDQDLLRERLNELLYEKVYRFHENWKQKARRAGAHLEEQATESGRIHHNREESLQDTADSAFLHQGAQSDRTNGTYSQTTQQPQHGAPVAKMFSPPSTGIPPAVKNFIPQSSSQSATDFNMQHSDKNIPNRTQTQPQHQSRPSQSIPERLQSKTLVSDASRPCLANSQQNKRARSPGDERSPRKTLKADQTSDSARHPQTLLVVLKLSSARLAEKLAAIYRAKSDADIQSNLPLHSRARKTARKTTPASLDFEQSNIPAASSTPDGSSNHWDRDSSPVSKEYSPNIHVSRGRQNNSPDANEDTNVSTERKQIPGRVVTQDNTSPPKEFDLKNRSTLSPSLSEILPGVRDHMSSHQTSFNSNVQQSTSIRQDDDLRSLQSPAATVESREKQIEKEAVPSQPPNQQSVISHPPTSSREDSYRSQTAASRDTPSDPNGSHRGREASSILGQTVTALERARLSVYWDKETDCPDFIVLRRCESFRDLLDQLEDVCPSEFKHKSIQKVQIRLTNPEAAGLSENPNCTIHVKNGEEAFENLRESLSENIPAVRPKLKLTVEFQN